MSVHVLKNGNLDGGSTAPHNAPNNIPRTPRKGAALRLVSTKDLERDDWLGFAAPVLAARMPLQRLA